MNNEGQKYDLIAEGFAKIRDSFNTEQKYLDLLIQNLPPKACILDVGCGSGYPIAAYFLQKGFQVTGVDASKELLKIAQHHHPGLKWVYGDVRTVVIPEQYDAIVEWWCLFHLPKADHAKMFERFAFWLKPGGFLEFTTGDSEYEGASSDMLDQELNFYSLSPDHYERFLGENGFTLLLKEHDQPGHLVWLAQKNLFEGAQQ